MTVQILESEFSSHRLNFYHAFWVVFDEVSLMGVLAVDAVRSFAAIVSVRVFVNLLRMGFVAVVGGGLAMGVRWEHFGKWVFHFDFAVESGIEEGLIRV